MRRLALMILSALLLVLRSSQLAAQETYRGCKMEGNTKKKALKAVNSDKNRYTPPADNDIDSAVTLAKILKIGDDTDRWDEDKGAEVVGYVYDVKPGGAETCNCGETDKAFKDTHIEIVPAVNKNDKTHRVIVEIMPRMRAKMAAAGQDWSTATLKATIKHKWVKVRGWLLWDIEHVQNASHTNPDGSNVWRATCWEIRPITSITVVPAPH